MRPQLTDEASSNRSRLNETDEVAETRVMNHARR